MAGETQVTVIGNLTADPELRYTQSGLAVVNLTVASTPRLFDRASNEWKDGDPLFLRGSAWREFAENIAGSFSKGSRVIVRGNLIQKSYETKEGEKRTSFELQIEDIGSAVRHTGSDTATSKAAKTEPDVWVKPGEAADVWNQAPSYTDETPF